jgi:hypothetical protein
LQLAERYQQLGYPELAIEHYRLASARFPHDASVAMKLANSLRDFNHVEDAIGVLANFCNTRCRRSARIWTAWTRRCLKASLRAIRWVFSGGAARFAGCARAFHRADVPRVRDFSG